LTVTAAVFGLLLLPAAASAGRPPGDLPNLPATDADEPLFADQWSMQQIDVEPAHAITGGSPSVRVAVIDSGIDPNHPDFAGRIDHASSVGCQTGTPVSGVANWTDQIGHGTLVAGLIGAGDNGVGIIGVAPHVQLVIVKVANAGQPITPAAVACAFNYVARQDIDVANASFAVDKGATGAADPFDFFCRSDDADHAAIKLVQKAVKNAQRSGTTVVASAGNNDLDLADPPLGNGCIRMPVELPGVVGVSSDTRTGMKSSTPGAASNFGVGVIDVTAPGGDPAPQHGGIPGGLVLSTFPNAMWRRTAGSSFATAHVSGVAALVVSRFGSTSAPQNGRLRPGFVAAVLKQTAEPMPCPPDPRCVGGEGYNGFFGHGEVDAFAAVTHESAP
jgi:subtilisin family serine protease